MGEHPGDDLQRLLDGRLGPERAAQVEAHIAECASCRREVGAIRQVKSALRQHLPQAAVPEEVAARVRATSTRTGGALAGFPRRRVVAAAAVLAFAAILLFAITQTRDGPRGIASVVAADFTEYRSGALRPQRQSAVAAELEQFFQQAEVPIVSPVFEFGGMGFSLAGASVRQDHGTRRALVAYESAGGDRMICEMYEGRTSELSGAADVRDYDGKRFFVYRLGDLTVVFWQDGPLVCVLVMDGDPERAIAFARAKAGAA